MPPDRANAGYLLDRPNGACNFGSLLVDGQLVIWHVAIALGRNLMAAGCNFARSRGILLERAAAAEKRSRDLMPIENFDETPEATPRAVLPM